MIALLAAVLVGILCLVPSGSELFSYHWQFSHLTIFCALPDFQSFLPLIMLSLFPHSVHNLPTLPPQRAEISEASHLPLWSPLMELWWPCDSGWAHQILSSKNLQGEMVMGCMRSLNWEMMDSWGGRLYMSQVLAQTEKVEHMERGKDEADV